MPTFDETPAGLIALLSRVDLYKQVRWQSYEEDDRREPTDQLTQAVCASSRLRTQQPVSSEFERHYLMVDLDVPAYLVPSTTPGHTHLYIDIDMPWCDYEQLLRAMAACGIIEPGYANASVERRSTTLRLPWIKKEYEPTEGDPMKVEFMKVDARGNWIPRAVEVPLTRHRYDAYAFIHAHADLVISDDGTAVTVNHSTRGVYLIRANVEILLDTFSIVDYLTWVQTHGVSPLTIAGGNDAQA